MATFGIIGLGDLSQKRLCPVLQQLKKQMDLQVIGIDVLENVPASLGNVVDKYIPSNGRIPRDVVASLKPGDVIYIATPPDLHLIHLFEVLCSGTGAIVAVEKPLSWIQDYPLAERACDLLAKYSRYVVYVDHYPWIDNWDQLLRDNDVPFEQVRHIDMSLIDNKEGAPSNRLYTLQDGMIGDCASHLYALLMKWLRHQGIRQYRLEVQETIAASYLENGQPLPIKGEMAARIQSKLSANGHTIDLTFRAGKGTGHVEKSARFWADDGTVIAECQFDSSGAYHRIVSSLLERRTQGFLRLPDALRILGWMSEAKTNAQWEAPYNVGEMPAFLTPVVARDVTLAKVAAA